MRLHAAWTDKRRRHDGPAVAGACCPTELDEEEQIRAEENNLRTAVDQEIKTNAAEDARDAGLWIEEAAGLGQPSDRKRDDGKHHANHDEQPVAADHRRRGPWRTSDERNDIIDATEEHHRE